MVINYSLVLTYGGQKITVTGHFNGGAAAQTGVELINFNGANGSWLPARQRLTTSSAGWTRPIANAGGVNLSTNAATSAQNFIAGETGTSDIITGGAAERPDLRRNR